MATNKTNTEPRCAVCEKLKKEGRVVLNELTVGYSGMELTLLNMGDFAAIRGRTETEEGSIDEQDCVSITHCPFCGKKYMEE